MPRLLDLFCGEGGAAMGYHRAGFEVVGVDISAARLTHYPFTSHHADALEYLAAHGHEFDAVHASPPCSGYSRATTAVPDRRKRYDRLIPVVREALAETHLPYVIENVWDARHELLSPMMVCWTQLNEPGSVIDDDGIRLWMRRHRLFESSVTLASAGPHRHPKRGAMQCAGAYDGARHNKRTAQNVRKGGYVPSAAVMGRLLGIDWMTQRGLQLSIPPAYTEYLGNQLKEHSR